MMALAFRQKSPPTHDYRSVSSFKVIYSDDRNLTQYTTLNRSIKHVGNQSHGCLLTAAPISRLVLMSRSLVCSTISSTKRRPISLVKHDVQSQNNAARFRRPDQARIASRDHSKRCESAQSRRSRSAGSSRGQKRSITACGRDAR